MTTPDPNRPGQPFPPHQPLGPAPGSFPHPVGQPGQYYPNQGGQSGIPASPFPVAPQGGQPNYAPQQFGHYPQPVQPQYAQPGAFPQPQYPSNQFPPAPFSHQGGQQPGYQQPQYQQPGYPGAAQQYAQPQYPQQPYPQGNFPPAGAPQAFSGFGTQPPSYPAAPNSSSIPQFPQSAFPQSAASPIPISARQVVSPTPALPVPVQPQRTPQPVPSQVAPAQAVAVQPAALKPSATKVAEPKPQSPTPASPVPAKNVAAAQPTNRPMPVGSRPVPVKAGATTAVRKPSDEDEEDEEGKKFERVATRSAPPWLVSLIVHMVIIIALALIYFALPTSNVIEIYSPPNIYAEDLGEQLEEDVLETPLSMELDIPDPTLAIDSNPVDDPFAAPPQVEMVDILNATTATSDISAPSIGLALSGREKGAKSALLAAYGGNATTEAAVREGLLWLKKNQKPDGTWSLMGPYDGVASVENVCSATSMALLAFQGHGDTHKTGEFKDVVAKGWEAMLKMQDADGNFVRDSAFNQQLYSQAQATIAVCEIYGMTKDEKFKIPAQKALDFAHRAQAPEGGWRYEPRIDSDTSVTGWFVMALQSGLMAGLEVQSPSLDKINGFLDRVQQDGGARYAYQQGRPETVVMTAEGLLCRMYLGWKHGDERLKRGIDYLLVNPITYNDQNVYYWYYATQALHHMEGPEWDKWNAVMRQQVPEHQIKSGAEKGSWPPADDRWGSRAGRLYTTCLSIYMLEVYYRHLPLYAQTYAPLTKN